jgi:hypothetical protein
MSTTEPDKVPRELTWGLVSTFVGAALLWLLTNLKSGVLLVLFSCWTIVAAVLFYRRLRKEGHPLGKGLTIMVVTYGVAIFLGMGAHALVDALKK